ncbi:MAG: hypothetical protein WA224_19490, partial [Candidatus Acidiferrales bacterium]
VRRNVNTDTPLPPEEPAGKNPPDGAIFDYYLQSAAAGLVTLQIIDGGGKVLRSYSSADKPDVTMEQLGKELNVPLYWIRPPQILSAAEGSHRFVWDLRIQPPGAVHHQYPISAIVHDTPRYPLGPAVLPGNYTVKLDVGGQSYRQPLVVKMDPRVNAPTDELMQQFTLGSRICDAMNTTYNNLGMVRALRAQLRDLGRQAPKGDVADAISALDQKTAPLEGEAQRFGSPSSQDSFAQLNGQFSHLLQVVDGADAAPTQTAQDSFADRQKALAAVIATWDDIRAHTIPSLNDLLLRAKLPTINLDKPLELESNDAGDDEP